MLLKLLSADDYSLGLSPGFFRFYAHIGVLKALEEKGCLRASEVTGSSAGALVGSFLCAGMTPQQMIDYVLAIEREHIWDMGGIGGLLKGDLFQKILESYLPVQTFEECKIPLGVTAYDVLRFKTKCITTGNIAQAVRASCTFPGLFQPVIIDNSPHIDGGVWDDSGLMSMGRVKRTSRTETDTDRTSTIEEKKLVVNIVCGRGRLASSKLPADLQGHRLLTIVMDNIPMVTPFSMNSMGPVAYNVARLATLKALEDSHMQELEPHHWCCYIDGNEVSVEARSPDWSEEVGHKRKAHQEASSSSSSSGGNKHQRLSNSANGDVVSHELLRVPSLSFLNRGVHEFHHPKEECLRKDVAAVSHLNRSGSGSISALNLSSFPSYSDVRALQGVESTSSGLDVQISNKKKEKKEDKQSVTGETPTKKKKSTVKAIVATGPSTPATGEKKKRVTRSAVKKKVSKMLD